MEETILKWEASIYLYISETHAWVPVVTVGSIR